MKTIKLKKLKKKNSVISILLLAIFIGSAIVPFLYDDLYDWSNSWQEEERIRKTPKIGAYNASYGEWLYETDVDKTTYYFNAKDECWIIAKVIGTDFTNFTLDGELYEVSYGINFFPIKYEEIFSTHLIEINQSVIDGNYYEWICVEPLLLKNGTIDVNLEDDTTISFNGGGYLSCLFGYNFSHNYLYLKVDDYVMKNIFEPSQEIPKIESYIYNYFVEEGVSTKFDINLEPGPHQLKLKGNGTVSFLIVVNLDWDDDLINDVEEINTYKYIGLDPTQPNAWGFFEMSDNYDVIGKEVTDLNITEAKFTFYLPDEFSDTDIFYIDIYRGIFINFTIDSDEKTFRNYLFSVLEWENPISQVYKQLSPGWHSIKYVYAPSSSPVINFRVDNQPILIFDEYEFLDSDSDGIKDIQEEKSELNPYEKDTDGDGINDNIDASPLSTLTLNKDKLTQIVLPHDPDRNTMVRAIINTPETDYSTYDTPREWQGEYNTSIFLAMRAFGKLQTYYQERFDAGIWPSDWTRSGSSQVTLEDNDGVGYAKITRSGDSPYMVKMLENKELSKIEINFKAKNKFNLKIQEGGASGNHKIHPSTTFGSDDSEWYDWKFILNDTDYTYTYYKDGVKQGAYGYYDGSLAEEGISYFYIERLNTNGDTYIDDVEMIVLEGTGIYAKRDDFAKFWQDIDGPYQEQAFISWPSEWVKSSESQVTIESEAAKLVAPESGQAWMWYYMDDLNLNQMEIEFKGVNKFQLDIQDYYGNRKIDTEFGTNGNEYVWKFIFDDATETYSYYRDGVYQGRNEYTSSAGNGVSYIWIERNYYSGYNLYIDDLKITKLDPHYEVDEYAVSGGGGNTEGDVMPNQDPLSDYMLLFPKPVEDMLEYDLTFPRGCEAKSDGNIELRFDFIWLVTRYDPETHETSILHFYDVEEDITMLSFASTEIGDINYALATPDSMIENQILWALTQNPELGNPSDYGVNDDVLGIGTIDYLDVAQQSYEDAHEIYQEFDSSTWPSDWYRSTSQYITIESSDYVKIEQTAGQSPFIRHGYSNSVIRNFDLNFRAKNRFQIRIQSSNTQEKLGDSTTFGTDNNEWYDWSFVFNDNDGTDGEYTYYKNDVEQGTVGYDHDGTGIIYVHFYRKSPIGIGSTYIDKIRLIDLAPPSENMVLYTAFNQSNCDILNKIDIKYDQTNPSFEREHLGDYDMYLSSYSAIKVFDSNENSLERIQDSKVCYTNTWFDYTEDGVENFEQRLSITSFPISIEVKEFGTSKVLEITSCKGDQIPINELPKSSEENLHKKIMFQNETFIDKCVKNKIYIDYESDVHKEFIGPRSKQVVVGDLFYTRNSPLPAIELDNALNNLMGDIGEFIKNNKLIIDRPSTPQYLRTPFNDIDTLHKHLTGVEGFNAIIYPPRGIEVTTRFQIDDPRFVSLGVLMEKFEDLQEGLIRITKTSNYVTRKTQPKTYDIDNPKILPVKEFGNIEKYFTIRNLEDIKISNIDAFIIDKHNIPVYDPVILGKSSRGNIIIIKMKVSPDGKKLEFRPANPVQIAEIYGQEGILLPQREKDFVLEEPVGGFKIKYTENIEKISQETKILHTKIIEAQQEVLDMGDELDPINIKCWWNRVKTDQKIKMKAVGIATIGMGVFIAAASLFNIFQLLQQKEEFEGSTLKQTEFCMRFCALASMVAIGAISAITGLVVYYKASTIDFDGIAEATAKGAVTNLDDIVQEATEKAGRSLGDYLNIIGYILDVVFLTADVINLFTNYEIGSVGFYNQLAMICIFDIGIAILLPAALTFAGATAWQTMGYSLLATIAFTAGLFILDWAFGLTVFSHEIIGEEGGEQKTKIEILDQNEEELEGIEMNKQMLRKGSLEVPNTNDMKVKFTMKWGNNGSGGERSYARAKFKIDGNDWSNWDGRWVDNWPIYYPYYDPDIPPTPPVYYPDDYDTLTFVQSVPETTAITVKAYIEMEIDSCTMHPITLQWSRDEDFYGPEVEEVEIEIPILDVGISDFYDDTTALQKINRLENLKIEFFSEIAKYDWKSANAKLTEIIALDPNFEYDTPLNFDLCTNLSTDLRTINYTTMWDYMDFYLEESKESTTQADYHFTTYYGEHNATYNFDNGTYGWEEDINDDTWVTTLDRLDGHWDVVQLRDSNSAGTNGNIELYKDLDVETDLESGTIEAWVRTTDDSKGNYIKIQNQGNTAFKVYLDDDYWKCTDNDGTQSLVASNSDQWYHVKIEFRASGGAYKDFANTFEFRVFIDGTEYGDYTFDNNYDVNRITFGTEDGTYHYSFYADAVGVVGLDGYEEDANRKEIIYNETQFLNNITSITQALKDKVSVNVSFIDKLSMGGVYYLWMDVFKVGYGDLLYSELVPVRLPFVSNLSYEQSNEIWNEDFTEGYWDLIGAEERTMQVSEELATDTYVYGSDKNRNYGDYEEIMITDSGALANSLISVPSIPYLSLNQTQNSSLEVNINELYTVYGEVQLNFYETEYFSEETVNWYSQPEAGDLAFIANISSTGNKIIDMGDDLRSRYKIMTTGDIYDATGRVDIDSGESSNKPIVHMFVSKNYQGEGIIYMQTNTTELLSLVGPNYGGATSLSFGDVITVKCQAATSNEVIIELINEGVVQANYTVVSRGNTNFGDIFAQILIEEPVSFDQLAFTAVLDDGDYFACYDVSIQDGGISSGQAFAPMNFTNNGNVPEVISIDISGVDYESLNNLTGTTGNYPATYSFEGETGETGTDIVFVENNALDGASCGEEVIAELDGHNEVLKSYDASVSNRFDWYHEFPEQDYGSIEYWVRITDATDRLDFRFYNTGGAAYAMGTITIISEKWRYYDGADKDLPNVGGVLDNTWYHVLIHFECTAGSYQGLAQWKWKAIVDGIDSGELSFTANNKPVRLRCLSQTLSHTFDAYLDAIGYSWDPNYDIGDNLEAGENENDVDLYNDGLTFMLMPGETKTIDLNLTEPFAGRYNATNSFTSESDSAEPEMFDATYYSGGTIYVDSEFTDIYGRKHEKVTHVDQSTYNNGNWGRDDFTPQDYGTIEGYIASDEATSDRGTPGFDLLTNGGTASITHVIIDTGQWRTYSGSGWEYLGTLNGGPINNVWYHVRVDFEHSTGEYMGLSQDTFQVFIDGELLCTKSFASSNQVGSLRIGGGYHNADIDNYFDAIGYSWDENYDIGDNLVEHSNAINKNLHYRGVYASHIATGETYIGYVDSLEAKGICVTSPGNATYNAWGTSVTGSEGIPLRIIPEVPLTSVEYSLDGGAAVGFTGNSTIIPKIHVDGMHSVQVFGVDSNGRNYQSELINFTVNYPIKVATPANKTYEKPLSEGTHDFNDEEIYAFPDTWTKGSGDDCEVYPYVDGMINALRISSGYAKQTFTEAQETGTIEFWARIDNTDDWSSIYVVDTAYTSAINLKFYPSYDKINIDTGAPSQIGTDFEYEANRWYLFKIYWDCAGGQADEQYWNLWIDGIQVEIDGTGETDLPFRGAPTAMTYAEFREESSGSHNLYMDGLGYEWENYTIGDNQIEEAYLYVSGITGMNASWYSLDGGTNKTFVDYSKIQFPLGNGLHAIRVYGNDSEGTIYESEIRRFKIKYPLYVNAPINKTYALSLDGHYPGTYMFFDDEVDSDPVGWSVTEHNSGDVKVVAEKDGHKKVVEMSDWSGEDGFKVKNVFSSGQTSGTVEFHVQVSCQNRYYWLILQDEDEDWNRGIYMCFHEDGKLYYIYNDATWQLLMDTTDDVWYHFKIKFDIDGNGDATDDWHLWIDGVEKTPGGGAEYRYPDDVDDIGSLRFDTTPLSSVYQNQMWADAVGYSWDPGYAVGDNEKQGLLFNSSCLFAPDTLWYSVDGGNNATFTGTKIIPMPSVGNHYVQAFGNDTLGQEYESDVVWFDVQYMNILTPANRTVITDDFVDKCYKATHGFDEDVGKTSTDIDFVDYNSGTSSTYISVEDIIADHRGVLQIDDQNGGAGAWIEHYLDSAQTSGTIEWWWRTNYIAALSEMRFKSSDGYDVFRLRLQGYHQYYDGSWHQEGAASSDTWYHYKIVFANGEYSWYVDGVEKLSGKSFMSGKDNIAKIAFTTGSAAIIKCYWDAFGYSWDEDYSVGNNKYEDAFVKLTYESDIDFVDRWYSLDGGTNVHFDDYAYIKVPEDGNHSLKVWGEDSGETEYPSRTRWFVVDHFNLKTPTNTSYSSATSGYYPGTYGFDDDDHNDDPSGWTVSEVPYNTYVKVVQYIDGHSKVLRLEDNSDSNHGSYSCYAYKDITAMTSGCVEMWVRTDEANDWSEICFNEGGQTKFSLRIEEGVGKINGGTWFGMEFEDNTWYHMKFKFECTSGNYSGLDQYEFSLYIDGAYKGTWGFSNSWGDVDRIYFGSGSGGICMMDIDAIGIVGVNDYAEGDNEEEGLLIEWDSIWELNSMEFELDYGTAITITDDAKRFVIPMLDSGNHYIQVSGTNAFGTEIGSEKTYFSIS